jgi:hypothetical protein
MKFCTSSVVLGLKTTKFGALDISPSSAGTEKGKESL